LATWWTEFDDKIPKAEMIEMTESGDLVISVMNVWAQWNGNQEKDDSRTLFYEKFARVGSFISAARTTSPGK
jgi:hypothetical protein